MSKEPTEDALIPFTCGECGHTVKKPIRWLRSNTILKCGKCGDNIPLKLDKDFIDTADALKEVMKTWEDIKKNHKR